MKPRFLFALTLSFALLAVVPVEADDVTFRTKMAAAIRAAANRVLPSVVSVEIVGTLDEAAGASEVERDAPTSGVILDNEGHIVASSIVVRRPSVSILVVLPDGTRQAAKVIARDHHRDLVLLKIAANPKLKPITIPSPTTTQIGQTAIAVGRYGSEATPLVSSGVLSARERLDGIALQTDARVSPSFYGGPMIDLSGNFLGVFIPAVAEGGAPDATSWYDSGIAFAIPSEVLATKIDRMRAGEDIKKGIIGIVSKSKDPMAEETEIAAVRARSPAEAAGIKAGDRVIEVDGSPVRRHQEIRQVMGRFDAGDTLRLKLKRGQKDLEVELELAQSIPPLEPQQIGVIASELGGENEEDRGVAIEGVVPQSAAFEVLKPGDVIRRIGETKIVDIQSLRRLMISSKPDAEQTITFTRGGAETTEKITPRRIAGKLNVGYPAVWKESESNWSIKELKLPDITNKAATLMPENADADSRLGLMVLLMNPGQGEPVKLLESWADAAKQQGVVICAVAPEDNSKWQPKELEVIGRFATAVLKKAAIDEAAVAVAAPGAIGGVKAEAADSMALAVAVSQSKIFFGSAVSPQARPPAVRIRENEPTASLQVLLPIKEGDELPTFSAGLIQGGYPVVRGGDVDQQALLRWVRLLQAI